MTAAPPSTQTAAQRRLAEAELRALVARLAPAHHALIGTMRRSLRKRLPTAHEVVYEYSDSLVISYAPNERGHEGVLALRASANGVALYFTQGKNLPDPAKLLRGSGRQARFIRLDGAATLKGLAVAGLIDTAIARHRVPFAPSGRGPVVIRATSAKRRRD
jgi:hypothetical protein